MIRPAHPGDAAGIARAHVESWNETYRGKLPNHAIDAMTLEKRIAEWERALIRPDIWTFVHESGGRIDGFASARRTGEEPGYGALLSTLYVLRSAQGTGVARALLGTLAGTLVRNGVRGMWLLTLRDENSARGFYERLGAVFVREQPAPIALGAGIMDVVYAFPNLAELKD